MPWFAVAGLAVSAVSAYGQYQAGQTAKKNAAAAAGEQAYEGYLNKDLRYQEADDVMTQAHTEADMIRAKAVAFRGAQAVQQAASGVMVGEGSAQTVVDQTTQLAMSDTLATLYSGVNKASSIRSGADMQTQASINSANSMMAEGNAKATAATISAGSTLLRGAFNTYQDNKGTINSWFKPKQ